MPKEIKIKIISSCREAFVNPKPKKAETYLDELEELSQKRNDGGLLHSGVIHFIQNKASKEGFEGFILKAAIYQILNNVPKVFPKNLPELIEENPDFKPTPEMNKVFQEINQGLLIPLDEADIVDIIKLAREYEELK